jgi:hypothetical protein
MFGEHTTTILMAAGVALAALVLLRAARRRPGQLAAILSAAGERSRASALANAPPELLRWQVEMHETARDLKAELDSKLAALQALVALAREERALLEATILQLRHDEADQPRGTLAAIESLGDPAALDDPERLSQVAARMPALPGDVAADLFERDRQSLAVSRLSDQGLSPVSIAEHLHLPLGEVELLLSLRAN